jgi:GMP synthase (glutamine-hydrolysing)
LTTSSHPIRPFGVRAVKTAVIVQHLAIETIGTFGPLLEELGYQLKVCLACRDDLYDISPRAPDLVVIMGGPIGVYDADDYPFLHRELKWLRERLSADLPTLGFCLGAQLIAAALGARVFAGHLTELGWGEIQAAEGMQNHPVAELCRGKVLHWHGDTFDLPAGARLLASSTDYPHQAFSLGRALALQFHVEVEPSALEQWFVGFTSDIRKHGSNTLKSLRQDTRNEALGVKARGEAFLRRWLDLVSLSQRAA